MNDVFLEIVDNHKAGDPINSEVNWTYLTAEEIRNQLEEKGIIPRFRTKNITRMKTPLLFIG